MTIEHLSWLVPAEHAGARLDRFLAAHGAALSRSRWQQLITEGQVRVNGEAAKANTSLKAGDEVLADVPPPTPAEPAAEAIHLEILYEDRDVVVVNKPAGLVVHPGAGNGGGTLVNALLHHCKDLSGIGGVLRPGIVHRLDKDTSGVLVAAKHDKSHQNLAKQFEKHDIDRAYVGLVWGPLRAKMGTFRGTLERDPRNRLRMTGRTGEGREAITHFEVVGETAHFARLKFTLETGRTHQIRVQSSEAGHPLVGDQTYGQMRSVSPRMGISLQHKVRSFPRQALHAEVLGFTDLKGKRRVITAPPPKDLEDLWALMQKEDHA